MTDVHLEDVASRAEAPHAFFGEHSMSRGRELDLVTI
jgi:hypothetical protein